MQTDSKGKLGLLLFQNIVQEVSISAKNDNISLLKRKVLEGFQNKSGGFVKMIEDILKYFKESDEINIIDNSDLDKHLDKFDHLLLTHS